MSDNERVHPFQNHYTSLFFGLVLMMLGVYLIWDAYDGRGMKPPIPVKLISPI